MLLFAAVPAIQGVPPSNDVNQAALVSPVDTMRSPGQILIDFDAQTVHAETGSLGAEWDGQYFWSSCHL